MNGFFASTLHSCNFGIEYDDLLLYLLLYHNGLFYFLGNGIEDNKERNIKFVSFDMNNRQGHVLSRSISLCSKKLSIGSLL